MRASGLPHRPNQHLQTFLGRLDLDLPHDLDPVDSSCGSRPSACTVISASPGRGLWHIWGNGAFPFLSQAGTTPRLVLKTAAERGMGRRRDRPHAIYRTSGVLSGRLSTASSIVPTTTKTPSNLRLERRLMAEIEACLSLLKSLQMRMMERSG
jgi:hypothetical protein